MSLTLQNLRAVGTGVEPTSLLPGQIAFNVTDKVIYVGDGSSFKTNFDGTQVAGVANEGWYAMPMDFDTLGDYYVANPEFYGDVPTDQQVLTWSTALNHPVWTSGGSGGGSQVYVVTNTQVSSAPGSTTSAKITAAIGVASPDEGDTTIVTGLPNDVYEGLYFFTTEWVKGAAYAYPSASEVIYNNVAHPTLGATVQLAIDGIDDGLIATTAIANTANSNANSALSIASAALPKAGGTMTGNITFSGTGIGVAFGDSSTIRAISDSVSLASSFTAGSSTAVKTSYDLADAAVPRSSYTATGDILYGTGSGTFTDLTIGTPGQVLIVGPGNTPIWASDTPGDVTGVNATFPITVDNTDPQQPTIGINGASTSAPGAVQLNDTVASTSVLEAATANATKTAYDAGIQGQADAATAQATADAAIPRDSYVTGGDLLVGTGAGTFNPLSVGNEGQVLTVLAGAPAWVDDTPGDVTSVTGTAPITVNNADPENPVVSVDLATTATPGVVQIELTGNLTNVGGVINVPDASTTVKGAVQLNNTLSSNSASEALTAAQGFALQLQIDALTLSNSVTLAGGYDATTGLVDGVTSQGTLAGFTEGAAPPTASATNVDHYLVCTVSGNNPSAMENGDWLLSVETSPGVYAYQVLGVGARPPSASYTTKGIVQLANAAAVLAGTSDNLAITPQALQDNVLDSVTTANSSQIASSTAVKTAYDAGILGQAEATAAQATANAALPKAGGTMTGTINAHNVNVESTFSLLFAGGVNGSLNAVTDATDVTSSTTAASATAVKAANDAAGAAQTTANAALPKTGGTMTGDITFQDAGEGVVFNGGSQVFAISDSTSTTSSTTAASATAVKAAFDAAGSASGAAAAAQATADAALPKAGGTMTGNITFQDAGEGVAFNGGSFIRGISDATGNTNNDIAASSTAVKDAYVLADAAVPKSCYTALGALAAGTGASTVGTLALGTSGQFLAANSACGAGLEWCTLSLACVPCAAYTAVGTILAGNGAGTYCSLPVGTNGQVLVPNSACAAGVEWVTRSALSICGYTCTATPFNTAIGANAGDSITSAVNNTAVGYNAGTANATGNNNTFVGFAAGDATTSDNNTALGSNALGGGGVNNNTAVGYNSGCSLTTGGSNTFVGAAAGDNTTTADNVVAVGYNALGAAHTANGTVAIGANTLAANTSGAGNTAVGFNSGVAITTGSNNTVLGFNAGDTISTGTQNTFLGACSGGSLAGTSEGNTGIGFSALGQGITSGAYNTVVGNSAGLAVTSGALNTLIGYTAGQAITTGGSNTLVGRYIGTSALSNNVVLSDGAGTIRFQSNASGAISLGAGGAYGTAGQVLVSQGSSAAPTWVNNTPDGVAGVTGTAPITVNNTDPANPIIGASAASTSAAGVVQLNDTVTSTSTTQAATANAVKAAYDAAVAAQGTANAALPKAGGTMTGNIVFSDAGEGVIFSDASSISGISDSVVTSSSIVAASSTAVKAAYDAALAAQAASPLTSATVLYVNVTTGNNSTGARGTAKPFATLTAALAAASTGDTIFVAPGTYVESPTLSKGVNIIGTFTDQTIGNGPKISGTFTVNITGAGTRNWAVANMIFQASSVGNNSVVVSNNSFAVGGIGCFDNCFFQQFTSASITEQCFATSGTWTRSLYLRSCTFDGNFTHNAGTTAGANGYVVIDNLLGIAGSDKYYKVMTGTCEFRSPSNALAPVLHTGGTLIASNVLGWISNVAATTSIFGGTGFAYKGTSAGLGQATVSLAGQGVNVVEGSTWGKVSVGANVIYAFGNVNYDTSLATLAGVPLYSVLPNPNGVLSTMSRPQWGYLTTPSSVTAANQLGVILDSTNGNVYTTSAFDAGTF